MFQDYFYYLNPLMALLGGSIVIFILIFLGVFIFYWYAKWVVYQKAGRFGWEAIIPLYSSWVLVEITGLKWWFMFIICARTVLSLLSFGILFPFGGLISIIGLFFAHYNLAKKFDKEPISYGIGLTILPIVFYPILAFSKNCVYNKETEVSPFGPISEEQAESFKNGGAPNPSSNKKPKNNNKQNFCKNCGHKIDDDKFCSSCGAQIK